MGVNFNSFCIMHYQVSLRIFLYSSNIVISPSHSTWCIAKHISYSRFSRKTFFFPLVDCGDEKKTWMLGHLSNVTTVFCFGSETRCSHSAAFASQWQKDSPSGKVHCKSWRTLKYVWNYTQGFNFFLYFLSSQIGGHIVLETHYAWIDSLW